MRDGPMTIEAAMALGQPARPAAIVQEYTGRWHLFASWSDAARWVEENGTTGGWGLMTVQDWIVHPSAPGAAGGGGVSHD